jgi:hypothetical protein
MHIFPAEKAIIMYFWLKMGLLEGTPERHRSRQVLKF